VGSNLCQGISLFSNSKKNVRGQVAPSMLTTNNNKLAWIAIWLLAWETCCAVTSFCPSEKTKPQSNNDILIASKYGF
jgi:hypothetical protein